VPLLEIRNLRKSFTLPDGGRHTIMDVPSFALEAGQHLALQGSSGSGKTTFLNLIAGILTPDEGSLLLAGKDLASLSEPQRDRHRALHVGYIFQTFNLLQGYTCLENILLGMAFGPGAQRARALDLLNAMNLADKAHHRPRQLSVGQQQRVAVARAVANDPKLVLADEPTGNLDPANAAAALQLIRKTCSDSGAALLLVSHDPKVLSAFDQVQDLSNINRASPGGAP